MPGPSGAGHADGAAAEARFDTPCGVAIDAEGNVYVADTGNDALRRISPRGDVITVDVTGAQGLYRPIGIAITADGMLYAADQQGRVVEVAPGGRGRVVAGSRPGFADGEGAAARFREPSGIAAAAPGRLIVADSRNALIRLVAAGSQVELRVPASPLIDPGFDAGGFSLPPLLWPFDSMTGPFEITGTMGEARGDDGSERFHTGLDVSGDQGMTVLVRRPGVVSSPVAASAFGTLSESIRVGPIAYVHLRVGRRSGNEPIRSVPVRSLLRRNRTAGRNARPARLPVRHRRAARHAQRFQPRRTSTSAGRGRDQSPALPSRAVRGYGATDDSRCPAVQRTE